MNEPATPRTPGGVQDPYAGERLKESPFHPRQAALNLREAWSSWNGYRFADYYYDAEFEYFAHDWDPGEKLVATLTLSKTASTATLRAPFTPASTSCSPNGMPSLSYVSSSLGSTSSRLLGLSLSDFGAEK